MTDFSFLEKVKLLPEEGQERVKQFIETVAEDFVIASHKNERISGQLKGKVTMTQDFFEPIQDFKLFGE